MDITKGDSSVSDLKLRTARAGRRHHGPMIAGQTVLGYIPSGGSLRRGRGREGKGYARAQRTLVRIIDALAKRKPAVLNDFISNPGSMQPGDVQHPQFRIFHSRGRLPSARVEVDT